MLRDADLFALQPEALAGRLFESARDAVIVAGEDGRIVLWNPAAEQMFGWSTPEAVGQPIEVIIPERMRSAHRAGLAHWQATGTGAYIESGAAMVLPAVRKDGREIVVQMTLGAVKAPGVPGRFAAAIVRDVTTQRQLEAQSRTLAQILRHTGDAVIGKEPDGTVSAWNPAAERMYGFSSTEILGRPVIGTIIPPDKAEEEREVLRRVLAGEVIEAYETVRVTKDGRRIFVSMTASPVRDEDGVIVGESEVERDITQKVNVARERQLALERLARISELEQDEASRTLLLHTASHELNTPIAVLRLQLDMLRAAVARRDQEWQQHILGILQRNVDRLARLTQDIVGIARLHAGILEVRRADLAALVQDALASFQPQALAAEVHLGGDIAGPLEVEADPQRLGQVLDNLLGNALKFTPAGGRVEVRAAAEDGAAVVEVRDTGPGLAPEQRAALFQPFVQAHGKAWGGTGLGLYIAKGIVEQHRGTIGVDSPGPGQGSVFWFRLPLASPT